MNTKTKIEISPDLERTASAMKALAHPLRLHIVSLLTDGPLCAGEIEKLSGSTQSNVSQHLSVLRREKVVQVERQGNKLFYHVNNWRIFKLISLARGVFG